MNKDTSKIHISSQTPFKDNFNLEKEVVNLAKVQKQTQDQIKISIIDLKLIQTISVKTKDKFLLREIFNLIRIIKNMKESHLIKNRNVLLLVLRSLLKKPKANN